MHLEKALESLKLFQYFCNYQLSYNLNMSSDKDESKRTRPFRNQETKVHANKMYLTKYITNDNKLFSIIVRTLSARFSYN